MGLDEFDEFIAPQLPVNRHEIGTAQIRRFPGFDGLCPSGLFRFIRTFEYVMAAFVNDDIFIAIEFDSTNIGQLTVANLPNMIQSLKSVSYHNLKKS